MPNSAEDANENDFVLKHRIAGAAFLLFFGALVLPWLLGPPSEAKKAPVVELQAVENEDNGITEDLESEILAELQETVDDDEQVYISKITPEGKVSELVSTKDKAEAEAQALVAKEQAIADEKRKRLKEKELKEQQEKQVAVQANDAETGRSVEIKPTEEERKRLAEAQLTAALDAESVDSKPVITSGWVVQVGMFVDQKKANNVFDDLGKKGFKPSTSVVDTNLGLKTGTRVWLGPFRERQDAVDMKATLAKKTGASGFIRAYP